MHSSKRVLALSLILTIAVIALSGTVVFAAKPPARNATTADVGPAAALAEAGNPYVRLPLQFEVNQGQVNEHVKFLTRGPGYSLFLTSTEAVLALRSTRAGKVTGNRRLSNPSNPSFPQQSSDAPAVLQMRLVGGRQEAEVIGLEEVAGKSNYFIGNQPEKWHTDVSNYARVQYRDVYPGIDLVYYGKQGYLEYDFVVAPGADPSVIKLSFEGAEKLHVDRSGDLLVDTSGGTVRWKKPSIYQESADGRRAVPGRYALIGSCDHGSRKGRARSAQQVGFRIAAYDRGKPLVIDPTLVYSTLVGGGYAGGRSGWDMAFGLAVDASGSAYITGSTASNDFPMLNPFQAPPGTLSPAFVTKLNPEGTAILYSTYLGEVSENLGGSTVGLGIAVDTSGHAYITGVVTGGGAFPTTSGAFQAVSPDPFGRSSFVTKLSPAGNALVYSSYLSGGPGSREEANDIAVDASGNAYVTGWTTAVSFPAVNPLQPSTASPSFPEAFVTKINASGSALVYSTPLGGTDHDQGLGIAVDASGRAYVTGSTNSTDFPVVNALQSVYGGVPSDPFGQFSPGDVFVARLNAAGSALDYSTYLGGGNAEIGMDVAVDTSGSAYVTGWTAFGGFPTTAGAFETAARGGRDPFVTKISSSGSSLIYSTYLGGGGTDEGHGIAVDRFGNAYVTGRTDSTDFPILNAFQDRIASSFSDAFVTELNTAGSALIYSTFLGGTDLENPPNSGLRFGLAHIAVDSADRAYVAGWTASVDFPTTPSAFQRANNGGYDAFVAKFSGGVAEAGLSLEAIVPNHGGNDGFVTATIHGTGFTSATAVRLVRAGEPDLVPMWTSFDPNGNFATSLFDLRGQLPGLWSVEATKQDTSSTLSNAFTIESGGGGVVFTDVIGPVLALRDRPTPFTFLFGNSGNTDALGVLVFIAGLPKDATIQSHFGIDKPANPAVDWDSISPFIPDPDDPDAQILPLFLPVIRAGETIPLAVTLSVPTARCISLKALTTGPLFKTPPEGQSNLCEGKLAAIVGCASSLPFLPNFLSCPLTIANALKDATCSVLAKESLGKQAKSGAWLLLDIAIDCAVGPSPNELLQLIRGRLSLLTSCAKLLTGKELGVCIASAFDPNDKVGSTGVGFARYVSGEEPLRYMVLFENKPEATAPAHEVVITDPLDPAKLDLATLSLGPIVFGGRHVIPPSNRTEFASDVDLRPSRNVIVRIDARLDKTTGLITWRFISLDPATGQPTNDPLGGFLPPNQNPPEGDGSVFFTVMAKDDTATGTEIRNRARIVFDTNQPIDTPEWLNTIDRTSPASQVLAPANQCGNVELRWSGSDLGSGIQSYTIFASEEGGPFTAWLVNTTATSGAFTGQQGRTYAFYSVARDHAGNLENPPLSPDATVTVTGNSPPTVAPSVTVNPINPTPYTSGKVTATVAFTDEAGQSHACSINWGDGSSLENGAVIEPTGVNPGSCTDSHLYAAVGVYELTMMIADQCGASGSAIYQYVVIYDPDGGFVTGGGWINSPAGAYPAQADLTGKANFGFVSKYQKNSTVPTGNTQFHFNTADFEFESNSYEWLVISGAKARYRGVGQVNGGGSFGFELTAWDGQVSGGGGVDRFRIKIWDHNQGDGVVYDNMMGASDGADPTTALGGGSIVIHKK